MLKTIVSEVRRVEGQDRHADGSGASEASKSSLSSESSEGAGIPSSRRSATLNGPDGRVFALKRYSCTSLSIWIPVLYVDIIVIVIVGMRVGQVVRSASVAMLAMLARGGSSLSAREKRNGTEQNELCGS